MYILLNCLSPMYLNFLTKDFFLKYYSVKKYHRTSDALSDISLSRI